MQNNRGLGRRTAIEGNNRILDMDKKTNDDRHFNKNPESFTKTFITFQA